MGARISKAFEISTFLSWSLALIPLLTAAGLEEVQKRALNDAHLVPRKRKIRC